MATVLFTGLGNYNFKEKNTYIYKDQVYQKYFPYEVAQEVMKPDKIFIISTQDSWNKIYEMKDQYPDYDFDDPRIKHIHFGTNDDFTLTWKLYGDIQSVLKPGDEVIIDSTLGIRSAQFVLMSIINYLLQAQNNLVLKDVFYAGIKHDNETIDYISIKEFLVLNEWSNAINTYFTTGSTANIESLVSSGKGTPEEIRFVNQLTEFTNDLNTIRLPELKNSYEKIQSAFEKFSSRYIKDDSGTGMILKTIEVRIAKELSGFTDDPETAAIEWLLRHDQIVQASTLITEIFYMFLGDYLLDWKSKRPSNHSKERNILKQIANYEYYYETDLFMENGYLYKNLPFSIQLLRFEKQISHFLGKEHYDADDFESVRAVAEAFLDTTKVGSLTQKEKELYDYINALDIKSYDVPKLNSSYERNKKVKSKKKTSENEENTASREFDAKKYILQHKKNKEPFFSHISQLFLYSYMKNFLENFKKTDGKAKSALYHFKETLFKLDKISYNEKIIKKLPGPYYQIIRWSEQEPFAIVKDTALLKEMIPLFNDIRNLRNEIDHAGTINSPCITSQQILSQENKDKIDQLLLLIKQGKKELE